MAFLTTEEIDTHLYGEIVDNIDRKDEDILQAAIDAAIAEVQSYLSNFDTEKIFNKTGDDRNPILLLYTKDIAVWHFIQLANPSTDLELRADRYEKATDWLMSVAKGQIVPDLPLPDADGKENNFIKWGGFPPRHNYF